MIALCMCSSLKTKDVCRQVRVCYITVKTGHSHLVCVSECALRTSTSRNKGATCASCLLNEL